MSTFIVTKEWQALPISAGTIENYSISEIEMSADKDHGITLQPREKREFKDGNKIFVRSLFYNEAPVRIVSFTGNTGPDGDDGPDNTLSLDDIHSIFDDIIAGK